MGMDWHGVVEPDSWNVEPEPPPPEECGMTAGDTVYWLSSGGDVICSGLVKLVSEGRAPGGEPSEIVVEYDGKLQVRHACQSWEQWYATAHDAYRAGIAKHSKTITDANKAMLSLVESQAKAVTL